VTQLRKQELM